MKKISLIITSLIILVLMILTLQKDIQNSFALLSTLGVLGILFLSYFYFEKSMLGTKEIAVIATLSAFTALSRIAFAPIPNVKPVTFLVALSGFVFGPYEGFLIGSTSAFLSNIFLVRDHGHRGRCFPGDLWELYLVFGVEREKE